MWRLIKSDLFRYYGVFSWKNLLMAYLFLPGFHYMVWFRMAQAVRMPIVRHFIKWRLFSKSIRFGIEIPPQVRIGKGFYIGHWGGIVVHPNAVIGDNCNISQGVVIGAKNDGVPVIGDRVYMAAGAKIIGSIRIGNDAAIGANAVVLHDIADGSVAVGVPAKVVSQKGSFEQIVNLVE